MGRVKQLILEHATVLLYYTRPLFYEPSFSSHFLDTVGKQNIEKHIEKVIFSKLSLKWE